MLLFSVDMILPNVQGSDEALPCVVYRWLKGIAKRLHSTSPKACLTALCPTCAQGRHAQFLRPRSVRFKREVPCVQQANVCVQAANGSVKPFQRVLKALLALTSPSSRSLTGRNAG